MSETKPLQVNCPFCGTTVAWNSGSAQRPFCSERCRNQDFIAWANEEQVIGGDFNYDDLLSEDIQQQK